MKRRNAAAYLGVFLITCLVLLGAYAVKQHFFTNDEKQEKELRGDFAMKALYLTDGEENRIFVDLTNGTPFYGTIPENGLYDEQENAITQEDLNSGDVVNIWGNGVIAESYPAQYHGIQKIQRTEQKNQAYLEEYGHYMEEFFIKPDLSQIPFLDVCYTQPEAIVTAAISDHGSYTWTYPAEDGEEVTETADAAHILQWEDLTEIETRENLEIGMQFSLNPDKVEVLRWTKEQREEVKQNQDTVQIPQGETVEVFEDEEGRPAVYGEPGYVYLVKGFWENGEVEYGFAVVAKE